MEGDVCLMTTDRTIRKRSSCWLCCRGLSPCFGSLDTFSKVWLLGAGGRDTKKPWGGGSQTDSLLHSWVLERRQGYHPTGPHGKENVVVRIGGKGGSRLQSLLGVLQESQGRTE